MHEIVEVKSYHWNWKWQWGIWGEDNIIHEHWGFLEVRSEILWREK